MITFRQFNQILNLAWDTNYDSKLLIMFHEEDGGFSRSITAFVKPWHAKIELEKPLLTAHLPVSLTFRVDKLKEMYRALKKGYKNLDCLMPIQITDEDIRVLNGPGRGSIVKVES